MSWIKTNLSATRHLVIALTSYNDGASKADRHDMEGLLSNKSFSTVLIKDLNNSWYTGRIEGAGENLQEVCGFLKDISSRYPEVLVIGDSMAGYGSILYGCLIGATRIVALSPQTVIDPFLSRAIGDGRFSGWFERLPEPGQEFWNLREFLNKSHSSCQIEVYASGNDRLDILHAKNIEKCRGVSVHILDHFDHWLASQFKRYGILRKILSCFILGIDIDVKNDIRKIKEIFDNILDHEQYLDNGTHLIYSAFTNDFFRLDNYIDINKISLTLELYPLSRVRNKIIYYYSLKDILKGTGYHTTIANIPIYGFEGDIIVCRRMTMDGHPMENIGIKPTTYRTHVPASARDGATYVYEIADFSSHYGDFKMGNWENQCVLHGPYTTIVEGNYAGTVKMRGHLKPNSHLIIDVAEKGGNICARRWVYDVTSEEFCLEIPFVADRDYQNAEIRVFVEGGFVGQVQDVELRRF